MKNNISAIVFLLLSIALVAMAFDDEVKSEKDINTQGER